ncbi:MAG: hypothetical protein R3F20_11375 [Planctomycetota bacterium]
MVAELERPDLLRLAVGEGDPVDQMILAPEEEEDLERRLLVRADAERVGLAAVGQTLRPAMGEREAFGVPQRAESRDLDEPGCNSSCSFGVGDRDDGAVDGGPGIPAVGAEGLLMP